MQLPKEEGVWQSLDAAQRLEITSAMTARRVRRGECLVEYGAEADMLYVVVFGCFDVKNADGSKSIAEIGAGELIGEIGFFAGTKRTASVAAARDSEVLEISRDDFEKLHRRVPEIQAAVTRALALRLAQLASIVRASEPDRQFGHSRVIGVIAAGAAPLRTDFMAALRQTISASGRARFLTKADLAERNANIDTDWQKISNWLSRAEQNNDLVVCIADSTLSNWTKIILHTADQLVMVGYDPAGGLNEVETYAMALFPEARRRLVLPRAIRSGDASVSAPWLRERKVFMVHHIAMQDRADFHSLDRFLRGRAIGYVAGGGGAYGPAHIGIYKAFQDIGVQFDICGGSSIGAAMAAAFATLMPPDEISDRIHDIFVRRAAMDRYNIPRYSLLDHSVLDAELRRHYNTMTCQDTWKQYFAVATDLSTYSLRVMREGLLWHSIRASCAIPGVLPPYFDDDGHMLVDGGVADNLPVAAMDSVKSGPNLLVDINPLNFHRFDIDYATIPGRGALLRSMVDFLPGKKRRLPRCPGPMHVIQRSMYSNVNYRPGVANALALTLRAPSFHGSSFLDWKGHRRVYEESYRWAARQIDEMRASENPILAAMLDYSRSAG